MAMKKLQRNCLIYAFQLLINADFAAATFNPEECEKVYRLFHWWLTQYNSVYRTEKARDIAKLDRMYCEKLFSDMDKAAKKILGGEM